MMAYHDHGSNRTNGDNRLKARRPVTARASGALRTHRYTEAAMPPARRISQIAGVVQSTTATISAVPAERRAVPLRPEIRTSDRRATGSAMAAIVSPMRPDATAPVIAGSNAYVAPAQMRIGLLGTSPRRLA